MKLNFTLETILEENMSNNVGGIDQILRIIAGVILCTFGVFYNSWWGLTGLIPLVTGTMS